MESHGTIQLESRNASTISPFRQQSLGNNYLFAFDRSWRAVPCLNQDVAVGESHSSASRSRKLCSGKGRLTTPHQSLNKQEFLPSFLEFSSHLSSPFQLLRRILCKYLHGFCRISTSSISIEHQHARRNLERHIASKVQSSAGHMVAGLST